MAFTGERVIPGDREHQGLFAEHAVRYLFARDWVAGRRVLDCGCGTGYGSYGLASWGATLVMGLDPAPQALAFALARYRGENLHWLQADGQRLPLAPASFDVVIAFEVLEHVPQDTAFLREIHRVLREDGVLLLSTPNKLLWSPDQDPPGNPFHRREYTPERLLELLERWFPWVELWQQRPMEVQLFLGPQGLKGLSPGALDDPPLLRNGHGPGAGQKGTALSGDGAPYLLAICGKKRETMGPQRASQLFLLPQGGPLNQRLVELEQQVRALGQSPLRRAARWAKATLRGLVGPQDLLGLPLHQRAHRRAGSE